MNVEVSSCFRCRRRSSFVVGELYIASDASEMYFHSNRTGGAGGLDIWVCKNINGEWTIPENVLAVNSPSDEDWPALSPDGNELWFSRDYAVWRSEDRWRMAASGEDILSTRRRTLN